MAKHFGQCRHTDTTEPNAHFRYAVNESVWCFDPKARRQVTYLRTLTDTRFHVKSELLFNRVL